MKTNEEKARDIIKNINHVIKNNWGTATDVYKKFIDMGLDDEAKVFKKTIKLTGELSTFINSTNREYNGNGCWFGCGDGVFLLLPLIEGICTHKRICLTPTEPEKKTQQPTTMKCYISQSFYVYTPEFEDIGFYLIEEKQIIGFNKNFEHPKHAILSIYDI